MKFNEMLDGIFEAKAIDPEEEKLDARELLRIHRLEMKVDVNGMLCNVEKVVEDKEKDCMVIVITASSLERRGFEAFEREEE